MSQGRVVQIGDVAVGGRRPFVLIAGPCVIEDRASALRHAEFLRNLTLKLGIPFIFKSSYDKANRTSLQSYRGPGLRAGLEILAEVKETTGTPVLTDVHEIDQVPRVSEVVDVLQIPAFLCRQTDFVMAVGRGGKPVNVKKGQFLAPWDMESVIEKIAATGNQAILLTERGTCFGYNNLVSDLRALPILARAGYPVVFDATHSLQLPGGLGHASGGQREFVPALARAATAVGVDGIFMEVHEDPDRALSDGPNSLALKDLEPLLLEIKEIDALVKQGARKSL
jgi:2-dehydro-3-deoxyphosphooctonate aldolase (KDO 8-P synthase)